MKLLANSAKLLRAPEGR